MQTESELSGGPAPNPRHRRLWVLRGDPNQTAAEAARLVSALNPQRVLWVGGGQRPPGVAETSARAATDLLGQDRHAVVLDLHWGLNADLLALVQGFVRGGGALLLRSDPRAAPVPAAEQAAMAIWPHAPETVGTRFRQRIRRRLFAAADLVPALPMPPPPAIPGGTDEQAALVARLGARLGSTSPTVTVLTADRGRGKSSAIGLALASCRTHTAAPMVVTALDPAALTQLIRFATIDTHPPQPIDLNRKSAEEAIEEMALESRLLGVAYCAFEGLLVLDLRARIIVVDEAAQVPVPWLRLLVRSQPNAHLIFASTVHGYEGTGRGFALRFLPWLAREPRPCIAERLVVPIRWPADDKLEAHVFDALLLDAEPTALAEPIEPLRFARLDRDALAADEVQLRAVFGLLVGAHYRTTPSDLHRLLDAPNLSVWVALTVGDAEVPQGRVVGACLLAEEGALPEAMVADAASGRSRLRGHALPDTLVAHLGETAAGSLKWCRSVRIASHPALRRLGIATRLTECIHATLAPEHIDTSQHIDGPSVAETPQPIDAARHMDAMGTLFGASAEVVRFRQRLGYVVVRLSASRGSRTGEPSVCMVRPFSPAAEALVHRLRVRFARDLPLQIELLQADVSPPLDPDLVQALSTDLPPVVPLSAAEAETGTRTYAFGPGTFEAEAVAVCQWVETHIQRLDALPPEYRGVVEARVIDRRGWVEAMNRSGLPSHGAVMRALRRAIRAMLAVG